MEAEILIQDSANKFSRYLEKYTHEYNGEKEFKEQLENELIHFYDPLDKLIFLYQVAKNIDIEYEKHLLECSHKDNPSECAINRSFLKCKFFAEQEIKGLNPSFNYTILRPNLNSNLLKQNLVELKDIPEAGKLFQSALDKLNESRFERNLLDDLRLCLESTLKKVLNNDKSLENQLDTLGAFLKDKDTSKELTNMFRTLMDYYSKYQNSYVKHNDGVKRDEIEFMVNLTSAFISFLINKK